MSGQRFEVNGVRCDIRTDPGRSLLHVLREDLDLTGCKAACGEGACGACTVLVDGCAVRSCVTPVGSVTGRRVTTIEGLASGGRLHPLQEAFIATEAFQCGFCTPGMIMSAVDLLRRTPRASTDDIVAAMHGNICRCGMYRRIVAAVDAVMHDGCAR